MDINNLVNKYKASGFKKTNNLLGVTHLKDIYEKGNLVVNASENGLFLFDNNHFIKHLYYYVNFENCDYSFDHLDSPTMIELIDKKNKSRYQQHLDFWKNKNFEIYSTNLEMRYESPSVNRSQPFILELPRVDKYSEIIRLYESGLDPIINKFPTKEEYISLIQNREIFMHSINDKVVATISCTKHCNYNVISHFIVDSRYRGLGIGVKMINEILKTFDYKAFLWVSEDNKNARNIYQKLGFLYTDKISIQLLGGKKND